MKRLSRKKKRARRSLEGNARTELGANSQTLPLQQHGTLYCTAQLLTGIPPCYRPLPNLRCHVHSRVPFRPWYRLHLLLVGRILSRSRTWIQHYEPRSSKQAQGTSGSGRQLSIEPGFSA